MIKIEHIVLPSPEQMEFIIEGMRNPMNSWEKSDSEFMVNLFSDEPRLDSFHLGPNDADLMQRLCKGGSVHRKYMRMMKIYMRVTAPLYWWKEFDTYKVGTNCNSCSTMHKIQAKEFTNQDFSYDHMTPRSITVLEDVINELNELRAYYLNWDNLDCNTTNAHLWYEKKDIWWQMIQLLPSSYNQTRNVEIDYETAANIYKWRHVHKLDEWVEFCKVLETLPYSDLIMEDAK